MLIALCLLGVFGERFLEVEPITPVDYLETPSHHLILDGFSELVVVDKQTGIESKVALRGDGPTEITVPLSITPSGNGVLVSGIFYTLYLDNVGNIKNKIKNPVRGPIVADTKEFKLFGTSSNYWYDENDKLVGYSGYKIDKSGHESPILPFKNPIGKIHPRCFSVLTYEDGLLLYGEPVTMDLVLIDGETKTKLPYLIEEIRQYDNQKPEKFESLLLFANSWDRFAANGAWVKRVGQDIVVMVTWDTQDGCLSNIWKLNERGDVIASTKRLWDESRPMDLQVINDKTFVVLASDLEESTIFERVPLDSP